MQNDINHMNYEIFLAEQEMLDKSALNKIRIVSEGSTNEIMLNEATNITEYVNKVITSVQDVWTKFKGSVSDLYNSKKYKIISQIKSADIDDNASIELKEDEEVPDFAEIDKFISLTPAKFDQSNREAFKSEKAFLKANYGDYFNNIDEKERSITFARRKCFYKAKEGNAIYYGKKNGRISSIKNMVNYLEKYKSNTLETIQRDIDNINTMSEELGNKIKAASNNTSTPAPTATNSTENNNQQATNAAFSYNSSYGILLFEDGPAEEKNSPIKEKNPAMPKAKNDNNNETNKETDSIAQLKQDCSLFLKVMSSVLSMKFNVANRARFESIKYCAKFYVSQVGNKKDNQEKQIETGDGEIKKIK